MMLPLAGVFAGLGATGLQGNAWFSVSGHVERVERPEMIAGPTGRHNRCDEAKARIVLESHAPGARVVDVARRHGVAAQQVTAWRRDARQGKLALPAEDEAAFAMLALDVKPEAPPPPPRCAPLEIEQDGVIVRLPSYASPERIAAVVAAVVAALRRAR
jgi:transposase